PKDENYLKNGIFTKDELSEISNHKLKKLPKIDNNILEYLNSFCVEFWMLIGLKVLVLRLNSPTGYVCRVLRTNMFEIPPNINEFGSKALNAFIMTLKAK
ncbi:5783_t:CDS:2, partial [Entrophospora sp. SA101]